MQPDGRDVPSRPVSSPGTTLSHSHWANLTRARHSSAGKYSWCSLYRLQCTVWVVKYYSNDDRATWIVLSFLVISKIVFQLRDLHSNRYWLSLPPPRPSPSSSPPALPLSHYPYLNLVTIVQVLTRYVNVKGLSISQMIHTSVKTRDWLSAVEPRNVRAGESFISSFPHLH